MKRRLSLYLPIFFIVILVLIYKLPRITSTAVDLAVFAIATMLLGLYLGYVLAGLHRRMDKLTRTVQNEALTVYKVSVLAKDLPAELEQQIMQHLIDYLKHKNHNLDTSAGQEDYQALLELCQGAKSKDVTAQIHQLLVDNQLNRSRSAVGLRSRVFSHEWMIMYVLYIVSLSFLLTAGYGGQWLVKFAAALLGACLGVGLMIVWKLSNLSHKKAWQIWEPYVKLISSDFKSLN